MTKSKSAFLFSVQRLARLNSPAPGRLFMWTFTLPTTMSVQDAKALWNKFLARLTRVWPRFRGLRVFELHDERGLHVHLLTCHWVHVSYMRELAETTGWGRVHVKEIPLEAAGPYLAKSFGRQAKCLKGWRLWAGFGPWTWTKVADIVNDTPLTRIYRACKERFHWTGNSEFFARMRKVHCILQRTILNGWTDGLGPNNRPYTDFDIFELTGFDRRSEIL